MYRNILLKVIGGVGVVILVVFVLRTTSQSSKRNHPEAIAQINAPGQSAPSSPAPAPSFRVAEQAASTNKLFLTAVVHWRQAVPEKAFAAFHDWAESYLQAPATGKTALEAEGIALAEARRKALITMIRTAPERALELAVPIRVRQGLPASVTALLEEQISGRGRLAVLAALPEPGNEDSVVPTWRTVTLGERELQAFAYGWRLGEPTRDNIPLNGIAVDNLMAVSDQPVRILEPEAAANALAQASEAICSISGLAANVINQPIVADVGGEIVFLCRPDHAVELNEGIVAAEDGGPNPGGDVEASTWSEGQKKLLLIRVDFPDLSGQPLSDATAISLINNLHNFYTEMSYGRAGFALNGSGSEFTPTFRLPQPAAYYGTNNYYNQLRSDARSAASAAGYVLADYSLDVICMGSVPGFGWAGLAYVGSAGAWLRNSFGTGVAGHELGHNFGLNHANFWDTSGQSVFGAGTSVEYGDSFDTMGSASAGDNHFQARYKSYLNWLTANETLTVTNSGTYRIAAHDNANSTGLRGLRIVKSGTTNYWVDFRQKFTSNKWLMNGAGLHWAQTGNQKSHLLDTTPGSTDAKTDSAIVIGRTFSDKQANIHITPIGKGGTSPESLDVVVNLGTFPGNMAPTVAVTASATNAASGAALTFTAGASDPNGDSLAYYWDFGDGNFGTNGPSATKSWTTGEYVVRCVVTDMKGGVGSDSLIVRIGSPSTYRISGQVTSNNGPVQGTRIYVSSTRLTYTDTDGAYNLVGLPAGTYTVNASLEGSSFTNLTFANPVSVGPNKTGIDLLAWSGTSMPPFITAQPQSQSVASGTNVTFRVTAVGAATLTYQWRFNGTSIPGATASSFTKANVQSADAGNYSAVVSNGAGAMTSLSAALMVSGNGFICSIEMLTNGLPRLTLAGTVGDRYAIESSTNLLTWTSAATLTNSTGTVQFTDPIATNHFRCFYRARLLE